MPHASRPTHHEHGVALVITVVLLTVIMFMTVTFLVVSHSQHGSVATETDQAVARLAADSARERAITDLATSILASTNEFNYGLLVSTNFINPGGFVSGLNSPTNVSYNYLNGNPLNLNDSLQNLANLLYDPRPPVFIATNALAVKSNEFRFFVDLNRNGIYDPSGLQPVVGLNGEWAKDGNAVVSNSVIGDPEWIGGLRRPEFAHSADNPFIYRYAYLVVPAGQTLDLNCIHNQAQRPARGKLDPQGGYFLRNQGVGTFEINLAAFLYDLNTNQWGAGYIYAPTNGLAQGTAFADAGALLAYRYGITPTYGFTLASVSSLFPGNGVNAFPGANAFTADYIDGYSGGPVMTGTGWPPAAQPDADKPATPWAGADNPNHFYNTQDLFDQNKTSVSTGGKPPPLATTFTGRLLAAGAQTNSYDRYTFYRLLSQLGTDSAPEPGGKMNLNYCNVDASGYVVPNMATNFIPWQPAQFFTNAAIRLLADAGYVVGDSRYAANNLLVTNYDYVKGVLVTNLQIQIWPTNFYTPSVHRCFQLAANMYDATTTTNRTGLPAYPYLPTIFRPVFTSVSRTAGSRQTPFGIYIIGYREMATAADTTDLLNSGTPLDLSSLTTDAPKQTPTNVYNIPLVIGAKKGLPNFNEFAMHSQVQVTRKLQFHRPNTSTTAPVNEIDQMFVVGISNVLGVEAWNSYAANYPRGINFLTWPDITVLVTNLDTMKLLRVSRYQPSAIITNILGGQWAGYDSQYYQNSLQVPVFTNYVFLSNMTYSAANDAFVRLTGVFERTPGTTNFHQPHLKLKLKTRLRFALVDTSASRIVDYVNLAADNDLDITDTLTSGGSCGDTYTPDGSNGGMWCTNRMYKSTADSTATFGIQNQIEASQGHTTVDWNSSTQEFPSGMSVADAIAFFKGQFAPSYLRSSNTFNAPFQPVRNLYLVTSWQANDPLVHYTVGDLVDLVHTNIMVDALNPAPTANLREINGRYEPWGGNPKAGSQSATKVDMTVKDPLMLRSDNWDFPTNKFPNVGWLGRVHRGSPWQTAYLKSFPVTNYTGWFQNWQKWNGNAQVVANVGQLATNLVGINSLVPDAFFAQPTNDWHLLDLFTTALNDNATRGQLSVNQTNLAAWSAVLSGVLVLTNNLDSSGSGTLSPWAIQPAGYYEPSDPATWPALVRLFNGINVARYNSPRHVFNRLSDILAVPEMTLASPFLNTNSAIPLYNGGLDDAAYERLPQQIGGLLKADSVPRFVIYSYGQTLKPESTRAIVKSGTFAGLCTNYQVVAEAATRTVVRLEGVEPNHGTNPITTLHPIIESINVLPPD